MKKLPSFGQLRIPIIIGCLLWTAIIGVWAAHTDSLTTDEGVHVASGYLALTRQDFRFDPEHPFLFKELTALPLLALHLNLPAKDQVYWQAAAPITYDSWQEARNWSNDWFFASNNNANQMLFLARIPSVIFLVLLCWFVYLLAKKLFGEEVALLALIFTSFNPTLLAHGHLANDDVAYATTLVLTLLALVYYSKKPDWRHAIWVGLASGACILTKFSGVSIVLIMLVFLIWLVRTKQVSIKTALQHSGIVAGIAIAMVWILYLGQHPGDAPNIWFLKYILPTAYAKGYTFTQNSAFGGRSTFVLGRGYGTGVWFYFPIVYLFKTQLAGLFLLGLGTVSVMRNKIFKPDRNALRLVLITFYTLILFALVSKLNIGIRHIAPLLALAGIIMALGSVLLIRIGQKWLVVVLVIAYILPVFFSLDNLIGFTNILVPDNLAYQYFGDSNLDWGQQSEALARLMKTDFPDQPLYIDYHWGDQELPYYGLKTIGFDPNNPPHGVLIGVTATQLSWDEYKPFQKLTPVRQIANHTFIFRLP